MKTGLQRLSAVWWGIWGLVGIAVIVLSVTGNSNSAGATSAVGAGVVACAYALHRVTCWVIAGFFAPET
jgi:hypothetical protein